MRYFKMPPGRAEPCLEHRGRLQLLHQLRSWRPPRRRLDRRRRAQRPGRCVDAGAGRAPGSGLGVRAGRRRCVPHRASVRTRAPGVGQSTGAYLLGLMPPELMHELGVSFPLIRRDPHYFLPTTDGRHLLMGADRKATEAQLERFFSRRDVEADRALQNELSMLREDVAPTWLQAPLSIEETAERHVRPALRETFVDLCRGSVGAYLRRFGFQSELLEAMYAVTDGFTGLCGDWDTPGSGMNFPRAQHVPTAGERRDVDGRSRRHGHGHPGPRGGCPAGRRGDRSRHDGCEHRNARKHRDRCLDGAGRASPCARGARQRRPVSNGFDAG